MRAWLRGFSEKRLAIGCGESLCWGVEQNNNKRKALAAVLVLGAGAIAIDQLILGGGAMGPESAAAAESLAITPVLPAPAPVWQSSGDSLSVRLAGLAVDEHAAALESVDAFRAPEGWFPPADAAEVAVAAEPNAAASIRVDQFKVGAVMTGGSAMATINGHPLRPGETKAGITLIEVRELDGVATVVFEFEGVRLEFTPTLPQQRP